MQALHNPKSTSLPSQPYAGPVVPPSPASPPPPPLTTAASLVLVEAVLLIGLGVVEAASLTGGRLTMGVTTAVFFLAAGVGLGACAWALSRQRRWGRGPVLMAQLIALGLAWNLRGGATTWLAVGLAAVALVVCAGLLHPASLAALDEDEAPAQS